MSAQQELAKFGLDPSAPVPDFAETLRSFLEPLHRERARRREEVLATFLRSLTPHEWGRVRVLEYGGPSILGGPGGGLIADLWMGPVLVDVADMTTAELGSWFSRTLAVAQALNTPEGTP